MLTGNLSVNYDNRHNFSFINHEPIALQCSVCAMCIAFIFTHSSSNIQQELNSILIGINLNQNVLEHFFTFMDGSWVGLFKGNIKDTYSVTNNSSHMSVTMSQPCPNPKVVKNY